MTVNPQVRVAIYCRISQDRDLDAESPERQEALCRALIASKGWTVAEVFTDRDASAYSRKAKRPGFDAMWAGVEAGRFDAVCVWKLDRLARRFVQTGPILSRLEKHRAQLVSVVDNIDTSTPMGQAIVGVLIAQAETESLNTSTRVRAARDAEAAQGKSHGGRRCFGYTTTRDFDPVEYPIAREAVERILNGASLRATARWLNETGALTASGKTWQAITLKQWLRAPAIAGIRVHKGSETPGNWEAIISPAEREALLLRLGTTRPSGDPVTVKNLLAGFVLCGNCGARMYVQHSGGTERKTTGRGRYRYCCCKDRPAGACGGVSVSRSSLEAVVVERLISFLATVERRPIEGDRNIAGLRQALRDDEAALIDISRERFVKRTLDGAVYQKLSAEISERIEATRQTLAAWEQTASVDIPTESREAIETWWETASLDARRAALSQSVKAVLVNPTQVRGKKFDPQRVGVLFRDEAFYSGRSEKNLTMDEFGNVYAGLEVLTEAEYLAATNEKALAER
jgi:DNA invertase Pin-like site-specific DNA recombinase